MAPQARSRRGFVDAALERRGLTRVVTTFSLALPLIVDSDGTSVMPRSFAQAHVRPVELVVRPVPLVMKPVEMLLGWHVGSERDPNHVWLRALLGDAARAADCRVRSVVVVARLLQPRSALLAAASLLGVCRFLLAPRRAGSALRASRSVREGTAG